MKLYGNLHSFSTQIVKLALEEKELKYDVVELNIFKNEHVTASYAKINPNLTVPTLQIGQDDSNPRYITDSLEIVEEIEKYGDKKLVPADEELNK